MVNHPTGAEKSAPVQAENTVFCAVHSREFSAKITVQFRKVFGCLSENLAKLPGTLPENPQGFSARRRKTGAQFFSANYLARPKPDAGKAQAKATCHWQNASSAKGSSKCRRTIGKTHVLPKVRAKYKPCRVKPGLSQAVMYVSRLRRGNRPYFKTGRIFSTSVWGRGMT